MNYKLDHRCEHLKSPDSWTAIYTLSFWKNDKWDVQRFLDNDQQRVFRTQEEAKERNRELARNWLSLNDLDGTISE